MSGDDSSYWRSLTVLEIPYVDLWPRISASYYIKIHKCGDDSSYLRTLIIHHWKFHMLTWGLGFLQAWLWDILFTYSYSFGNSRTWPVTSDFCRCGDDMSCLQYMLTWELGFLQVTILRSISVAMTHPIDILIFQFWKFHILTWWHTTFTVPQIGSPFLKG